MLADLIQLNHIRSQNGCTFHARILEHVRVSVTLLLCKRKTSADNLFRTYEVQELNCNLQAVFWSAASVSVMLFSLLYHHQYYVFNLQLSHISHSVL